MSFLKAIADYTPERKNSYEVTIELKVRKMLEKHTNYLYEFRRTEDVYDTDITAIRYEIMESGWKSKPVGFIEVEETPNWIKGQYPSNWRTYSYLARKVLAYDKHSKVFVPELVKNADKTIYLKVARDLSDCHCSTVLDIANFYQSKWIDQREGFGDGEYNRLCLRLPLDSFYVKRGVENCMKFILEFLK
jgi:hypothetical protein